MLMAVGLGVFSLVCVVLFALRNLLGLFWTAGGFYAANMAYLAYGFDPPVPASVMVLYGSVLGAAVLLYVTSSEAGSSDFFAPLVAVMTQKRLLPMLGLLLIAVPTLVAWQSYEMALPPEAAPPKIRSVHPSPPSKVPFTAPGAETGSEIDVLKGDNPYREWKTSAPAKYATKVALGKKVYYENCFFCHGDDLAAEGHYAPAFKPTPANFQDPGNIPMLRETFLFWRIAKGGPGLPDAGTPWDSSMPVWEKMLNEDEIWAVILYLYEHTGYDPRGKDDAGEH